MTDMSAKDKENAAASGAIPSEESCRCFSLSEIVTATNNFDDDSVIGIGGFGKVYKASIDNGTITVAIKRLKDESKQGAKEFWTEIKMLSKLRHTHLVALIGYCNECEEMILVYEYIARGTLADHLYKISRKESGTSIPPLVWEQRLQICVCSARGLDYLHTGTHQTFIHLDVKTTNILLDEEWVAKISDFGLSKTTTSQSMTHVSTELKGTWGYLDPDYFYTHKLTTKSDVYAFGVVLLEVLCGRPPVDGKLEEEQRSLVLWAQHCIKKGKLDRIIDPFLIGQMSSQCLKFFVEIANNCLHKSSKARPTMAKVVARLEFVLASHRKGKTKGIVIKMFKGMNHWWSWEGKYNNSKSESEKENSSKSESEEKENSSKSESERKTRLFSLSEIKEATEYFNKDLLIGRGGSSTVYKGFIDRGTHAVAIKITKKTWELKEDISVMKDNAFLNEVEFLSGLNHKNLVRLLGYCEDSNERILVFEYRENGTLHDHMHKLKKSYLSPLIVSWSERIKVALDAAKGIEYLHMYAVPPIIHLDINSSNILLDDKWNAKVSDFGLSLMMGSKGEDEDEDEPCLSLMPGGAAGTMGYIDPEYFRLQTLTAKSDVYSFGIVLLELLSGYKAFIGMRTECLEMWSIWLHPT